MHAEDTPDRRPEKPQSDHQFETPVVREDRPARVAHEEHDEDPDGAPRRRTGEREMAFEDRWENVQRIFAARGRRGLGRA